MAWYTLYALSLLAWRVQSSEGTRCAVQRPDLVKGGSDQCEAGDKCFSLVQYLGESSRTARHLVGEAGAFLVQSQGCFKSGTAPLICSRRKCVLAVTSEQARRVPLQFCCCVADQCNEVQNTEVRELEPSTMRILASNQHYMETFLRNNTFNLDALYAKLMEEMYETFLQEDFDEDSLSPSSD